MPRLSVGQAGRRLRDGWVGLWSRWREALVSLIAISAVIAVAAATALGERLTEERPSVRIAVLALSLLVLLVLVITQVNVVQGRGTLYYVRMVDEWMTDLYRDAESEFGAAYGDEKTVTEHITSTPVGGVLDLAGQVKSLSDRLEMVMSQDNLRTTFTIAPNLLFPAALAVGYSLHPRGSEDKTQLVELGNDQPPSGWRRWFASAPHMTWSLPTSPPSQTAQNSYVQVWPDILQPAAADSPRQPHQDDTIKAVLITVYLTTVDVPFTPMGLDVEARHVVGVPGCPLPQADELLGERPENDRRPLPVMVIAPQPGQRLGAPDGHKAEVDPTAAARAVVAAITGALVAYPNATIYLAARMPKTVSVAVGFGLSGPGRGSFQDSMAVSPAARRPWTRLVPLLVDQAATRGNEDPFPYCHTVRVHPAQPSGTALTQILRRDRLSLPPTTRSDKP